MRIGVNSRIHQYAETGIPYFIKNLHSTALSDKKWDEEEIFFFQTESFTHSELKDKSIWLFSGIGNPQAFEDSVTKIGSNIENHIIFPDHYSYKEEDFEKMRKLWKKADEEPEFIITTEKDYFRLKSQTWLEDFSNLPLTYIQMELKWWEGEEKLIQLLKS